MDITSWVDWCAVLGFGLSLALAIAELLRRRKRLAVSLAKAVFAGEGDLWCNLFLTITNQSSVAISMPSPRPSSCRAYSSQTSSPQCSTCRS